MAKEASNQYFFADSFLMDERCQITVQDIAQCKSVLDHSPVVIAKYDDVPYLNVAFLCKIEDKLSKLYEKLSHLYLSMSQTLLPILSNVDQAVVVTFFFPCTQQG